MSAYFDRRSFGIVTRRALHANGSGYRVLAKQIGVTTTDLSRVVNGLSVSVEKTFAIADWIGVDARDFYTAPHDALNKINVLQSKPRETSEQST